MPVTRLKTILPTPKAQLEAEGIGIQGGYAQIEVDSFKVQLEEALAYHANGLSPTPLIDAILSESGETKPDLVARILYKSAVFKVAVGKAIGRKRKKLNK